MREGEVERTVETLYTSITMAEREPGWRVSGGRSALYSGVPNSYTVPSEHQRSEDVIRADQRGADLCRRASLSSGGPRTR